MKYSQDVNVPSKLPVAGTRSARDMQFSSPMPWILAMVLSLALWAAIGWSVWRFVQG